MNLKSCKANLPISIFIVFLILCIQKEVNASNKVLFEVKINHEFSNFSLNDTFKLSVIGSEILKSNVTFNIISFDGTEIYSVNFPSIELINYDLPKGIEASKKDQEQFILKRLIEFFNEKNFFFPAIKEEEKLDSDYSDKTIWFDIKEDRTAIGFYYSIGEEDNRKIAFSKRTKKVLLYYNCC
ncbi:MAG: hypothetical protein PHN55_15590 [Dysgonamonadaceae bacterium]|nr:hypothetical protein [Dysgonamonadaceae bacterium]